MNGRRGNGAGLLLSAAVGAAFLVTPGAARAGDWSLHVDPGDSVRRVRTEFGAPVYELRTGRVWVEPIYVERVIEVEVPAVVRTREVPVRNRWGRVIGYRQVRRIVAPARTEYRTDRVLVREGYYKAVAERVRVVSRPVRLVPVSRAAGLRFGLSYTEHRSRSHGHRGRHSGVRVAFGG